MSVVRKAGQLWRVTPGSVDSLRNRMYILLNKEQNSRLWNVRILDPGHKLPDSIWSEVEMAEDELEADIFQK